MFSLDLSRQGYRPDDGGLEGDICTTLDTEGWPLDATPLYEGTFLADIQYYDTHFDLKLICGPDPGAKHILISMPYLSHGIDQPLLEAALTELHRRLARKDALEERACGQIRALAHDLKHTHPAARLVRRLRAARMQPYVQNRIASFVKTNGLPRQAALMGSGAEDAVSWLYPHLPASQILHFCQSQTTLAISKQYAPALQTHLMGQKNGSCPSLKCKGSLDLLVCPDICESPALDPWEILTLAARMIRPGGHMLMTVPRYKVHLTADGLSEERPLQNSDRLHKRMTRLLNAHPAFKPVTTENKHAQHLPEHLFLASRKAD